LVGKWRYAKAGDFEIAWVPVSPKRAQSDSWGILRVRACSSPRVKAPNLSNHFEIDPAQLSRRECAKTCIRAIAGYGDDDARASPSGGEAEAAMAAAVARL